MEDTLIFAGYEMRGLLVILSDALDFTARYQIRPSIMVNGKRYQPFDLLKVAGLLPADCKSEGQKLAQKANSIAGAHASAMRAKAYAASLLEA